MTDGLAVWLRAQLADDERAARDAAGDYPSWEATSDGTVCQVGTGGSGYLATGAYGGDLFEVGHHIARHDPARVLAEVDAKRKLLECLVGATGKGTSRLVANDEPWAIGGDHLVRLLALPYADRPGYRPEWAPDAG